MVPRSMCKDEAEYLQMLRDEFAAKAMQAATVNAKAGSVENIPEMARQIAEASYVFADAMLEARKK